MQRLIDHLRYGTLYQGDATRDTLDYLERLAEAEARVEALDDIKHEIIDLQPYEDCLQDVIDLVASGDTDVATSALEILQAELNGNAEQCKELLNG